MTKKSAFALLLLLISFLPACNMKDAASRMSLELKQVRVKDMTPEGFNATVYMQVNNPNNFSIRVSDFKYQAFVNGREMAKGRIEKELKVPAEGYAVAELPMEVSYGSMGGRLTEILRGNMDYRIAGEVVLKTWLGSYILPFDTRKRGKGRKEKENPEGL